MNKLDNITDLRDAIDTHATALAAGDNAKAEAFALPMRNRELSASGSRNCANPQAGQS